MSTFKLHVPTWKKVHCCVCLEFLIVWFKPEAWNAHYGNSFLVGISSTAIWPTCCIRKSYGLGFFFIVKLKQRILRIIVIFVSMDRLYGIYETGSYNLIKIWLEG